MTITLPATKLIIICYVVVLLAVATCPGSGRPYNVRKIRHDHKGQSEGTQSDVGFEFETTKSFPFEDGSYDDDSTEAALDDVTMDVVHSLYDTRKGVVPNLTYQGKIFLFYSCRFQSDLFDLRNACLYNSNSKSNIYNMFLTLTFFF